MAGGKEPIEVRFRLFDGTDIGPTKYDPSTTVSALKEFILARWPFEQHAGCLNGSNGSRDRHHCELRVEVLSDDEFEGTFGNGEGHLGPRRLADQRARHVGVGPKVLPDDVFGSKQAIPARWRCRRKEAKPVLVGQEQLPPKGFILRFAVDRPMGVHPLDWCAPLRHIMRIRTAKHERP